ncbi:MAG: hypothetical protein H6818_17575 [Phycisphaerales bacterium]|nr:hypothetical protein [Phycisphaerales bacterium]
MKSRVSCIGAAVLLAVANNVYSNVICIQSVADKLTPADSFPNKYFGWSCAVSGNTAAIGAYRDHQDGVTPGAVYVYENTSNHWDQVSKLRPIAGTTIASLGYSVAIDGDTIVAGAYRDDGIALRTGTAYIFRRISGIWQQTARLMADDGTNADEFGASIAISGDTIVVGAPKSDQAAIDAGSVYVFQLINDAWYQTARLTAPNPIIGAQFGSSVAISGATIVVGMPRPNHAGPGSVHAYRETNGVWQPVASIASDDTPSEDLFGGSVSIDGDTIAVGATLSQDPALGSGAVFVFRENAGQWERIARLSEIETLEFDNYGISVCLDGDRLIVGAATGESSVYGSGVVYVYQEIGGVWQRLALFESDTPKGGDYFGQSVSVSGTTAVVGAYRADGSTSDSGAAFAFDVFSSANDCNANGFPDECDLQLISDDCNGNGIPDECDIASQLSADCNGDGVPDECGPGELFESATLVASDGSPGAGFGKSIAMGVDTVVLGAYRDSEIVPSGGAAYVFQRDGGWEEVEKLTPTDIAEGDEFGFRVAMDGDTIAVAAVRDDDVGTDSGSVYVFQRLNDTWQQVAKLHDPNAAQGRQFGYSIALSQGTCVIGSSFGGSASVYREVNGIWEHVTQLTSPEPTLYPTFGSPVAIDGDTIAVAAPIVTQSTSIPGAVFVYRSNNDDWQLIDMLVAPDPQAWDYFGRTLGISGTSIVVGLTNHDSTNVDRTGFVYVYTETNSVWQEVARLEPDESTPADSFGSSLAIQNDTIVVGDQAAGAIGAPYFLYGPAHVFKRIGESWMRIFKPRTSQESSTLLFGADVSIEGNTVLVSALQNVSAGGGYIGTVLAFAVPDFQLAGDLDDDTDVDLDDASILIDVLLEADADPDHVARADVNCSGAVDGRDLQAIVVQLIEDM